MPRRPRTHQLEALSQRAFASALPAAWTVSPFESDYGLDRIVEIFDANQQTTGLQFHVQLKATDEAAVARALGAVRFRRDTADYYRSLRLPVLIVLYHAPTETLYARWFHAYNLHIAANPSAAAEAQTVRFQFEAGDAWTRETPQRLEEGVRGFNVFRSPELNLPLTLAVDVSDDARRPELAPVTFALRRVLAPVSDLVSVEQRPPGPDTGAVVLATERTIVSLGDVASTTLDHSAPSEPRLLAANAALSLALALSNVGQPNLAAQIAAAVAPASSAIADPGVIWPIAGAMYRSRRIREAVELADALDATGDGDLQAASFAVLSVLMANRRELTPADRERTLECATRRYERRAERGDTHGAAAELYSRGMLHRRLGEDDAAITCFHRAAELDLTYLDRTYFHHDLASVFFESGRYEEAVTSYARAVELGATGMTPALLADALLWAGRYREAQEHFERHLAGREGAGDAEWRLKLAVLPLLREVAGDVQPRRPEDAARAVAPVDFENAPEMTPCEAWARLDGALALDACCAAAWFRRAILIVGEAQAVEPAASSALSAAVLDRTNPSAWSNALMTTDPQDERRLHDLLHAAYRHGRDDFAEAALEVSDAEHLRDHADRIIELLDEAARQVEREDRDEGFTMRFNGPGGVVREVAFSPPSG